MRTSLITAAFAGAIVLGTPQARAVEIVGLNNTGSGVAEGAVDPSWTVRAGSGASQPTYVTTSGASPLVPGTWLANDLVSKWLTPSSDFATGNARDPVGNLAWTLSFDLTGFDPATASFAGQFLVDNQLTSILLNGTDILNLPSGPVGGFGGGQWTPFAASSAFVAGTNILTFNTVNLGSEPNPAGLRVEFTSSDVSGSAVPEPATWLTMATGMLLIGAALRRRRGLTAIGTQSLAA